MAKAGGFCEGRAKQSFKEALPQDGLPKGRAKATLVKAFAPSAAAAALEILTPPVAGLMRNEAKRARAKRLKAYNGCSFL